MSILELALSHRILSKEKIFNKHGVWKLTRYTCKCPTENCNNSVSVEKIKHINNKCRHCAMVNKPKGHPRSYIIHTTDINNTHLAISKANPKLFIREEKTIDGKSYVSVMKCKNDGCNNEIRLQNTDIVRMCKKCCNKKKPHEGTFNRAQCTRNKTKSNGITIKWLISYEEFVSLCKISNCHYCNVKLNRNTHRSVNINTAVLLDRVDSNKDYTIDNCVPCCVKCNITKNEHLSYEEMILIMKHRGLWVDKTT